MNSATPSEASLLDKISILVRTRLWVQIIVGMVLGIAVGLALSPSGGALVDPDVADKVANWVALPGRIFLALIQLVVVVLVLTSIVVGIASGGNVEFLKRVGSRIAPYFVGTTIVATTIGALIATSIEPGAYIDSALVERVMATDGGATPVTAPAVIDDASIPDKIVALIPDSLLSASLEKSMLQVVFVAILLAVALLSVSKERARPLLELFVSLQEVAMKVVAWAMLLAPWAVFGLLAQICIKIGVDAILGMSVYVGAVMLGLLVLLAFYLLLVAVLGRRNPFAFLAAAREAQLLAFSTSSSAAVMPLSMQIAHEKLKVKKPIVQFIVPLGATVNMDGTALYQVIAAVFLTQVFGIDLTLGQLVLLTATTVGASIGSPSTPGVGIVILATIVAGIGVPPAGVALILGVDRILDMSRTAINVTGDLAACVVMNRWLGDSLDEEPQAEIPTPG